MRLSIAPFLVVLFSVPAFAGPFEDGKALFEQGKEEAAFEVWKPLAEAGDANAQFWLGQMYDLGRGVTKDYAQAMQWYRRAAEQGNPVAQHNLANMYEAGQGAVPSEYSLRAAASWYRRAAMQGYKPAEANLGILYANGRGVRRDYVEAYTWFVLAGSDANRQVLARKLTPQDIATAERRAREWKAKPERLRSTGLARTCRACRDRYSRRDPRPSSLPSAHS